MNNRLAIIRPAFNFLDISTYNCQEIGLSSSLCKMGWDVDFYLYGNNESNEEIFQHNGHAVTVYRIKGIKLIRHQALYPGLFHKLSMQDYNLIQVHEEGHITSILIAKWARKHQIPVILYQGVYKKRKGITALCQAVMNILPRPSLRNDIIYALAKTSSAKTYLEQLCFSKVEVLPVGLDSTKFSATDTLTDGDAKQFAYRFKHILIYVGSLNTRKQPLFLLKVFRALSERIDVGMILIGNGPEKDRVNTFIQDFDLQKKIYWKQSVPNADISQYYSLGDVFLLPSYYEIFGMVILEALYLGVPVLSYSTPGAKDIISSSIYGHVFDNFDVGTWVKTCEIYLQENNIDRNLVIQHIKVKYNWDAIAARYIQIYRDKINNE